MKIKFTCFSYFIIFCLTSILSSFSNCSEENSSVVKEVPIVVFAADTLVSVDYTFDNEGLNQPAVVKQNPVTNEIIVTDFGNNCLYFFDENGVFIRKIGRMGQGPGEFLGPRPFEFDREGRIYVYEDFNRRMNILSKEGKYISSFRIINPNYTRFSTFWITNNKEILVNLERSSYFITVFNETGKVLRYIGPVPEETNNPQLSRFNEAFIFSDEHNNFYTFSRFLGIINIYNEAGDLKRSTRINDLLEGHFVNVQLTSYKDWVPGASISRTPINLMISVFFDGSYFYIKARPDYFKQEVMIFKMNKNLELIQKLFLGYHSNSASVIRPFSLLKDNTTFLFPLKSKALIVKFVPKE